MGLNHGSRLVKDIVGTNRKLASGRLALMQLPSGNHFLVPVGWVELLKLEEDVDVVIVSLADSCARLATKVWFGILRV